MQKSNKQTCDNKFEMKIYTTQFIAVDVRTTRRVVRNDSVSGRIDMLCVWSHVARIAHIIIHTSHRAAKTTILCPRDWRLFYTMGD